MVHHAKPTETQHTVDILTRLLLHKPTVLLCSIFGPLACTRAVLLSISLLAVAVTKGLIASALFDTHQTAHCVSLSVLHGALLEAFTNVSLAKILTCCLCYCNLLQGQIQQNLHLLPVVLKIA